jgi:TolA-binding protein
MAHGAQKDLLGRLADASEDALQRIATAPGADKFMGAIAGMRDQMDQLSRRVRGMEDLERRLRDLERKVEDLSSERRSTSSTSGSSSATARKTSSSARKKTTSSRKSGTKRKSSGSS